ncbi:MAG: DUF1631 domain-containing protein [Gammaproteobacteria bacterium]|nr:DUF1631 domain-containing protein [Gammaproteobacteria bacterium]
MRAARQPARAQIVDRAGRDLINASHHQITGELLHLLDGFYLNIEDGLFELAYRSGEDGQRRRCFDLMRELRFRRTGLVKNFARAMDRQSEGWFEATQAVETGFERELDDLVARMADKSASHFAGVLVTIAERAEAASARTFSTGADLPISPVRIAQAFVHSCRSLRLDRASIEIIQELFSRFVLDGLGSIYGNFNERLRDAGYLLTSEIEIVAEVAS